MNQSGFRSKHSCVTALTKIVDEILKEMDNGNYTDILFLDFKNEFDLVNHTLLLSKLKSYGIDDLTVKRFTSYLSHRTQKTVINSAKSSAKYNCFAIPQGVFLALCFFCYTLMIYLYT